MGYLTQAQKDDALDLVHTAGQYAKELNQQLRGGQLGSMDRKALQELGPRVAAINAQWKAGAAMIGANMAFSEAEDFTGRLDGKSRSVGMLAAEAERPAEPRADNGKA